LKLLLDLTNSYIIWARQEDTLSYSSFTFGRSPALIAHVVSLQQSLCCRYLNFTKRSLSWGADTGSGGQEIPYILFIAMYTRARHWTISWASWVQSTQSHTFPAG